MPLHRVLLFVALAVALSVPAGAAWPFRVVVHPSRGETSLTVEEVAALFRKDRATWPDGTAATPVDQSVASPVREAFSRVVLGREPAAMRSFWQRQVFEGNKVPPPELPDDAAVLAAVAADPGGVGYVAATSPLTGVRAARLVKPPVVLSRVEPEYPSLARRAREEGQAIVDVDVDAGGRVVAARARNELPYGMSEAAVGAVARWRFEPALVDGEPAPMTVTISILFER